MCYYIWCRVYFCCFFCFFFFSSRRRHTRCSGVSWARDVYKRQVINLLCKGSLRHLEKQLRKTPDQHVSDIKGILKNAECRDMEVNIYLEDWSNGMIHSESYVIYLLDSLKSETVSYTHLTLPTKRI